MVVIKITDSQNKRTFDLPLDENDQLSFTLLTGYFCGAIGMYYQKGDDVVAVQYVFIHSLLLLNLNYL